MMQTEQEMSPLFVENVRRGKQITLPYRELSRFRHVGWLALGGGLLICLFMLAWCWTPLTSGIELVQQGQLFGWAMIAFAGTSLFGWIHGFKAIRVGIAILTNRVGCRLILDDEFLISEELAAGLRIPTKQELDSADALYLLPLSELNSDDSEIQFPIRYFLDKLPSDSFALTTEKNFIDNRPLAAGYPIEVLRQAADLLLQELNRDGAKPLALKLLSDKTTVLGSTEPKELAEQLPLPIEPLQKHDLSPELPDESLLDWSVQGSTWVCKSPAAGLIKGSKGLFFFSCLWIGFIAIFTAVALLGNVQAGQPGGLGASLVFPAVIGLFWIVGIGMLIGSIHMGLQTSMIGVEDQRLFIERKSIFGSKWIEFEKEEVSSIYVGDSGMEVNDVPIQQLLIQPVSGKLVGLLTNLSEAELDWLAWQLNQLLELPPPQSNGRLDLNQTHALPDDSLIKTEIHDDEICIKIPPLGFLKLLPGLIFGTLFLAITGTLEWFTEIPLFMTCLFMAGTTTIMVLAYIYHTRRFEIAVNRGILTIERFGLASHRHVELTKDEIKSISVADSQFRVNNHQTWQLIITPTAEHSDKKLTLMTGRRRAEIAAVGSMILKQLDFTNAPESDPNEDAPKNGRMIDDG